jgi:Na+-driven multidrug efflux pump
MIGAPLASSISEGLGFVYLLVYLLTKSSYKKYAYSFFQKINLRAYFAIIKLSFPLMLQGVIALSTWLVFFTLLEHSGKGPLETAHNIRYMYFLAFVPIFGFAASTKTIVSNLVGQGRQDLIKKVQNRIIFMSVLSMVIIFHGAILYPEFLIRLVDQNPNLDPVVLADSVYILRFISGSILIYSIAVIYFNTIAGLGKTTVYFFIEVFSIFLYLVGCYFFIVLWKWDIKMVWWVEYIYFLCFLIFSVLYLYFYRRNLIKNE